MCCITPVITDIFFHRKLPSKQLSELLTKLYVFIHGLPTEARREESKTMVKLVGWNSKLDGLAECPIDMREEIIQWFTEYIG